MTPSVNSAQGADALWRNCRSLSNATGGSKFTAADSTPSAVAISSGCSTILRSTSTASAPALWLDGRALDEYVYAAHPELVALAPPAAPWQPHGRGALLLPTAAGTDGMYVLALRPPGGDLASPYRVAVPSRIAQFQRPINVEFTTTLKL